MPHQYTFLSKTRPNFSFEKKIGGRVAGIDEAGRGPLAGPIIAAAVILDPLNVPDGLNDSKKLSPKKRDELFDKIMKTAHVGIGQASVSEIDEFNILEATMLTMRRALKALPLKPDGCLVDGNSDPNLPNKTICIVKGDSLSLSIAAASIVAKVTRDKIMIRLAEDYPDYGWERNAGYGVPHHLNALKKIGPCQHHRKSFSPVRELISLTKEDF